jgi:hypothetical protein
MGRLQTRSGTIRKRDFLLLPGIYHRPIERVCVSMRNLPNTNMNEKYYVEKSNRLLDQTPFLFKVETAL